MADGHHPRAFPLPARGFGFLVPAIAWALSFTVLYSLQGAGCGAGLQEVVLAGVGLLRVLLALLVLAALAVIGWVGHAAYRECRRPRENNGGRPAGFLSALTLTSAALFLVATAWVGFAVLVFDPCEGHLLPL